jgi:hypothetical protein
MSNGFIPKRDVILTLLHGVPADYAAAFFASLRRTGYRGEVVVFAGAMTEESLAGLSRQGVRVVPFKFRGGRVKQILIRLWPVWRLVFNSRVAPEIKERLARTVFHLFYLRHLLYLQFLRAHRQDYDRVFLTDARDVYFQADPFSWNPPAGVHVFLEVTPFEDSEMNLRWIARPFGTAAAAKMKGKTISCAGTVFGDMPGILQYLETMVTLSMGARSQKEVTGDQGIHNYLVHQQPFPGITIHDNRTGPVLTIGAARLETIRFNAEGWVVDDTGAVAPVLHQYDRHSAVEKALLARLH